MIFSERLGVTNPSAECWQSRENHKARWKSSLLGNFFNFSGAVARLESDGLLKSAGLLGGCVFRGRLTAGGDAFDGFVGYDAEENDRSDHGEFDVSGDEVY